MVTMQIKAVAHFYQQHTHMSMCVWRHVYRRMRDIEIQLNHILRGRARAEHGKKNGTIFLLGIPAFDIVSYVTAMTLFSCATHVTYVQHAHCSAAVPKLRQYILLSGTVS